MYKKLQSAPLTIGERWCDSFLVTYPISIRYNGGTTIDGKWFQGYIVPKPKIPKGFKVHNIGCSLNLNAHPPYATVYLYPADERRISKKELQAAIDKAEGKI